jgi:S1-C subfamily serine protease
MLSRETKMAFGLSLCLLACAPAVAAESAGRSLAAVVSQVNTKLVKIYGAGGLQGLEAYQSGWLISPAGHVATVFSYVLDSDEITVVLHDGRHFRAKLLGADPRLEVAVLKIEATGLPAFDLCAAVEGEPGTSVLAFSNLFGAATGSEPASVQHGVIAVRTTLDARRGAFETPYRGPVYVLDAVTNNPGAAGGALTTSDGQLLGMLGKELRNALNNTWLNYAVPVAELRGSIEAIRTGRFVAATEAPQRKKPDRPVSLARLGLILVPEVGPRTPPFVDALLPGSPAARAGLVPDDLIVLVGERLVQNCRSLAAELEGIDFEDPVHLGVLRGNELKEFTLQAAPERKAP